MDFKISRDPRGSKNDGEVGTKMDQAQSIDLIMRKFRILKQPTSTEEIESSEAYSYLYNKIVSSDNEEISKSIFGILVAELQLLGLDSHYFNFTEKILKVQNYNRSMLSNQIHIISINNIDSAIKREKFLLYISILNPILIFRMTTQKDYGDLNIFLSMVNSILISEEESLVSAYINCLLSLMEFFEDDNSKMYNFIVGNNLHVFRGCADFSGCDHDVANYFIELADFYEGRLEKIEENPR